MTSDILKTRRFIERPMPGGRARERRATRARVIRGLLVAVIVVPAIAYAQTTTTPSGPSPGSEEAALAPPLTEPSTRLTWPSVDGAKFYRVDIGVSGRNLSLATESTRINLCQRDILGGPARWTVVPLTGLGAIGEVSDARYIQPTSEAPCPTPRPLSPGVPTPSDAQVIEAEPRLRFIWSTVEGVDDYFLVIKDAESGKLVREERAFGPSVTIHRDHLPHGLLTWTVLTADGTAVGKDGGLLFFRARPDIGYSTPAGYYSPTSNDIQDDPEIEHHAPVGCSAEAADPTTLQPWYSTSAILGAPRGQCFFQVDVAGALNGFTLVSVSNTGSVTSGELCSTRFTGEGVCPEGPLSMGGGESYNLVLASPERGSYHVRVHTWEGQPRNMTIVAGSFASQNCRSHEDASPLQQGVFQVALPHGGEPCWFSFSVPQGVDRMIVEGVSRPQFIGDSPWDLIVEGPSPTIQAFDWATFGRPGRVEVTTPAPGLWRAAAVGAEANWIEVRYETDPQRVAAPLVLTGERDGQEAILSWTTRPGAPTPKDSVMNIIQAHGKIVVSNNYIAPTSTNSGVPVAPGTGRVRLGEGELNRFVVTVADSFASNIVEIDDRPMEPVRELGAIVKSDGNVALSWFAEAGRESHSRTAAYVIERYDADRLGDSFRFANATTIVVDDARAARWTHRDNLAAAGAVRYDVTAVDSEGDSVGPRSVLVSRLQATQAAVDPEAVAKVRDLKAEPSPAGGVGVSWYFARIGSADSNLVVERAREGEPKFKAIATFPPAKPFPHGINYHDAEAIDGVFYYRLQWQQDRESIGVASETVLVRSAASTPTPTAPTSDGTMPAPSTPSGPPSLKATMRPTPPCPPKEGPAALMADGHESLLEASVYGRCYYTINVNGGFASELRIALSGENARVTWLYVCPPAVRLGDCDSQSAEDYKTGYEYDAVVLESPEPGVWGVVVWSPPGGNLSFVGIEGSSFLAAVFSLTPWPESTNRTAVAMSIMLDGLAAILVGGALVWGGRKLLIEMRRKTGEPNYRLPPEIVNIRVIEGPGKDRYEPRWDRPIDKVRMDAPRVFEAAKKGESSLFAVKLHEQRAAARASELAIHEDLRNAKVEHVVIPIAYVATQDYLLTVSPRLKAARERPIMNIRADFETMLGPIRGLAEMHKAGIVHRDVKLDNFLVTDDGRGFVCDLGDACRADDPHAPPSKGTPGYRHPEWYYEKKQRPLKSHDAWAACVALHEWLTGKHFLRGTPEASYESRTASMAAADFDFGVLVESAPALVEAIRRGLSRSSYKDAAELLDALERARPPIGTER